MALFRFFGNQEKICFETGTKLGVNVSGLLEEHRYSKKHAMGFPAPYSKKLLFAIYGDKNDFPKISRNTATAMLGRVYSYAYTRTSVDLHLKEASGVAVLVATL